LSLKEKIVDFDQVIILLGKNRISPYGFNTPKRFYFRNLFLAGYVTGFTGSLIVILTIWQDMAKIYAGTLSRAIFITWIFTPLAIEIFSRGLLLSYLLPLRNRGLRLSHSLFISIPVLLSAVFGIFVGYDILNIGQSGLYTLVMFVFGFPLAIVFGKNRQFNSIFFSRNICKFGRRCAGIL